MIFWIVLAGAVLLISAMLAYRSMRNYQEIPAALTYGLYLIRNSQALDSKLLEKIYSFALNLDSTFSFERLFKGKEHARAIYCPTSFVPNLPELNLLELEDYLLKKELVDESFGWVMHKISPDTPISKLASIELEEDQNFFWQIVCFPVKIAGNYQVTIRAVVVDKDSHRRMDLAKNLIKKIEKECSLISKDREQTTSKILADFKNRSLIPKEVSRFILSSDEILTILRI